MSDERKMVNIFALALGCVCSRHWLSPDPEDYSNRVWISVELRKHCTLGCGVALWLKIWGHVYKPLCGFKPQKYA